MTSPYPAPAPLAIAAALTQFRLDAPCGFTVEGVAAIRDGSKFIWSVNYTASQCSKLLPVWEDPAVLDRARSWFQAHTSSYLTFKRVTYVAISIPAGDFVRYQVHYTVN